MKTTTLFLLALTLVGCGDSNDSSGSATSTAASTTGGAAGGGPEATPIGDFWDDFLSSQYSQVADDAAALDAAAKATPEDSNLALYSALAHFWHLAEAGRDPSVDPSKVAIEGLLLKGLLTTAMQLRPDDARINCWLGGVDIISGRATNNQDQIDAGVKLIDEGIERYPEFNLFCKAISFSELPVTDPNFAKAPEALWTLFDTCLGETLDRKNPDYGPYLDHEPAEGNKAACWNAEHHVHGLEGSMLYMGDVLVKQGDIAAAKVFYANAKKIPDYASWPYKKDIEDRMSADLSARTALYADADPMNDPPLGVAAHGCTSCHASSAAE